MKRQEKETLRPSGLQTLLWEGEPVLSLRPPAVQLPAPAPRRVARYYRRLEAAWLHRWEGPLYRRACAAAQEARSRSRPFAPWIAGLTAEAEAQDGLLRVRWQAEEEAEGRRCVLSREDLWQLPGGAPVLPPKSTGKLHGIKK